MLRLSVPACCLVLGLASVMAWGQWQREGEPIRLTPSMEALGSPSAVDSPYAAIDQHALSAPFEVEQSVDALAEYLVKPAQNDRDKVRTIFRWMTDRISYDVDAFLTGHPGEVRPEGVLYKRRATCTGYTALFEALARKTGLQTATIIGYGRGVGYYIEDDPSEPAARKFQKPNHAWNVVWLEGRWQLLDVTWGAGFVRHQRFHKVFQEQYFLAPPGQLVLTHLPVDPRWQCLRTPLSLQHFEALPPVDVGLFAMGITHEALWKAMRTTELHGFVRVYAYYGRCKLLNAPLNSPLIRGRDYHFLVEAPQATHMALVNNNRPLWLRKTGTRFEAIVRPESGELKLAMQCQAHDKTLQPVLVYAVNETGRPASTASRRKQR